MEPGTMDERCFSSGAGVALSSAQACSEVGSGTVMEHDEQCGDAWCVCLPAYQLCMIQGAQEHAPETHSGMSTAKLRTLEVGVGGA